MQSFAVLSYYCQSFKIPRFDNFHGLRPLYNFLRSTIRCVGFENTVGFTDPAAPGSSTGYHFETSSVISEGHPVDISSVHGTQNLGGDIFLPTHNFHSKQNPRKY